MWPSANDSVGRRLLDKTSQTTLGSQRRLSSLKWRNCCCSFHLSSAPAGDGGLNQFFGDHAYYLSQLQGKSLVLSTHPLIFLNSHLANWAYLAFSNYRVSKWTFWATKHDTIPVYKTQCKLFLNLYCIMWREKQGFSSIYYPNSSAGNFALHTSSKTQRKTKYRKFKD